MSNQKQTHAHKCAHKSKNVTKTRDPPRHLSYLFQILAIPRHSLTFSSSLAGAGDNGALARVEWAFQLPHQREQWIASESVDDLFALEAARPRADRCASLCYVLYF